MTYNRRKEPFCPWTVLLTLKVTTRDCEKGVSPVLEVYRRGGILRQLICTGNGRGEALAVYVS
jgi:hypothetical protein